MKKTLLVLSAVLGFASAAGAVSPEVHVSYGGYNQMDACDNHDGWHNLNTSWGSLNAGVDFDVIGNLSIGPSYTFSSTTTKGGSLHSKISYHAIMINAKYDYWRNSIVTLYAHAGMGAIISHMQPNGSPSYNKGYCAYQISPIGARGHRQKACYVR